MMTRMGMRKKPSKDFKEMRYPDLLRLCNSRFPKEKFDIVLKCWDIHGGKNWCKHCGAHTDIMYACRNSPEFDNNTSE